MCKGGSTQTTTSTSQPPPQVMQAYSDAYGRAQAAAGQPYQPYTGQTVAPLTPQQEAAIGLSSTSAGNWNPYAGQAQNYLQAATQPLYDTVSQYESPYTNDVVNATQAQFNNQNAIQQQGIIGNAVAQGAWGGDRSAVAQGIVAGQQQLAQAPVLAGLRNTGYQTALNANEAGNWLNSQAAGQESALGQANFGIDQATLNQMMQFGTVGQAQQQAYLNVPYYQYQASQAYPFQTAGFLANVAEGLGSGAGGTSATTAPGPSTLSQIGGLGLGAAGIVGATGGFGSNGWLSGLVGGGSATGGLYRRGGIVGYAPGGGISPPMGGGMPFGAGSPNGIALPDFSVSIMPTGQGGRPTGQFSPMGGNGQTSTTTGGGGAGGILGDLGAVASIGRLALALERGGAVPRYDTGGGIMGNMLPYQGDGGSIVPAIRMAHGNMGPPRAPGIAPQPQGLDTSLNGLINIGKATGAFGKNGWLSNLANNGNGYRRGGGIVGHYDDGGGVGLDDDDDYGGGGDLIVAPVSSRNSFLESSGAVPAGSTAAVPDTDMGIAGVPVDLPPVQVEGGIAPAPAKSGRSGLSADAAAALVKKYESNGGYNVGFGGADLSNAPLDQYGFPQWAGKTGSAGMSHAAGAYQFEPATWAKYAAQLGIKDFSPASQDAVFRAAYADQGMSPWAPYNSRLRAALGNGDPAATESYGPSSGSGIAPSPSAGGDDSGSGMGIVPSASTAAPETLSDLKTPGVNPWLALAAAGFGMAAGRSPSALQNIGAGALEGVKMLESQRQNLPETRLKSAQADLAQAQAGAYKAQQEWSHDHALAQLDKNIADAHKGVANSGETAAVPVPGGSVAPLASGNGAAPAASAAPPAPVTGQAAPQAPAIPYGSVNQPGTPAWYDAQYGTIQRDIDNLRTFPAAPGQVMNLQAQIIAKQAQLANMRQHDPRVVAAEAQAKINAETPGLVAREGQVTAARTANTVETGRPGSYILKGGQPIGAVPEKQTIVDPVTGRSMQSWIAPPVPGQTQQPGVGGVGQPGQNGQGVITALGPGEHEEMVKRAATAQTERENTFKDAQGAQYQQATLRQMEADAGNFYQGPFSQRIGEAQSLLRLINPAYDTPVASRESFIKNAGALTRQATKEASPRAAFQEMQFIEKTLPNPEMSPKGIQQVIGEYQGLNDYRIAKAQALTTWEQQHNNSAQGFEDSWQSTAPVTPYTFIVNRMAQPERQAMFAKWNATPEGRAELLRMKAQMTYAANNKWLQ